MSVLTPVARRSRRARRIGAALAVLTLTVAGSAAAARPAQPTAAVVDATAAPQAIDPVCSPDQQSRCLLSIAVDANGDPMNRAEQAAAELRPFTAADLQDAYHLPSDLLGARQTIAIVAPFSNPHAEADLAVYREVNDLPPCTSDFPCFRAVNQRGGDQMPPGNIGWGVNINVGLQMASAACPNCQLLVVGADSTGLDDLNLAVDQAASQGADVIVAMYGGLEYDGELADAVHYDHPGVVITAPAGDSGFGTGNLGLQLVPAAYGSVVAVGGTTLFRDTNPRGWGEAAMDTTGSGCSAHVPRPAWQPRDLCGDKRTVADTAAVADFHTPVAFYDSFGFSGWLAVSGAATAAALVGGVYALAGNADTIVPGQRLSRRHKQLYDVTVGSNGTCGGSYLCTAVPGYDGPTGFGTPLGIGAF